MPSQVPAPQNLPATEDEEIDLLELLRAVFQYKWMFSGIVVFTTVLSIAVSFFITPVYRAEVLIVPAKYEGAGGLGGLPGQLGGLTALVGVDLGGGKGGGIVEYIETLKSRAFTVRFIEEQDLLPILFAEKWSAEEEQWMVDSPEDVPTLQDAFRIFKGLREIDHDKISGLITLSIDWTDRELAAHWANTLVARVNESLRQRAIVDAQNSLDYLKIELEKTNVVGLQQAIYRLIEKEINEIMLANVRDEYAFRIIDPAAVLEEEDRISPKRKIIAVIGLLLGILIGCSAVLARRIMRSQG